VVTALKSTAIPVEIAEESPFFPSSSVMNRDQITGDWK
jgi:hypothetical protein